MYDKKYHKGTNRLSYFKNSKTTTTINITNYMYELASRTIRSPPNFGFRTTYSNLQRYQGAQPPPPQLQYDVKLPQFLCMMMSTENEKAISTTVDCTFRSQITSTDTQHTRPLKSCTYACYNCFPKWADPVS